MKTILNELGLDEKDFKIEILGEPEYKDPFSFNPNRTIIAKINGTKISCSSSVNIELLNDLSINVDSQIENILKREIINCYINDPQIIRKRKLQKIKEKYE